MPGVVSLWRRVSWRIGWPSAVLLVLGAPACRDSAPPSASEVRLVVGLAQPQVRSSPDAGLARLAEIFGNAAIITLSRDGRPAPGLADRWTTTPDGLEWRFDLAPGLSFHDDTPLGAVEVVAAIEQALAEPGPAGLVPGLRDVTGVEATSPTEVVVRLARPSSLLPEALAILPVIGAGPTQPGAGPFRPVDERIDELEAFAGFHRGRPAIDRISLRSYETPRMAWAALMRDEIDVLHEVAPEALDFVAGGSDVRLSAFLRPYLYLVGFNVHHPVLRDARVRVALNFAVDRPELLAQALNGRGQAADGPLWPRHWAVSGRTSADMREPTRAADLLDAAGTRKHPSLAGDRPPSRFRLTCLLPADYPVFERLALALQRQLLAVDVDLDLEPLSPGELARRLSAGDFDVYLLEMASGPGLGWTYWFWRSPEHDRAWVRSGYTAADASLDALRLASDDDTLAAAVAHVQHTMRADPPAIFLFWGETTRAVHRRFEVPPADDRDVLNSVAQWRLREVR